jgi:hypothetical protein
MKSPYILAIVLLVSSAVGVAQCTSAVSGQAYWWWSDPQYTYTGSTLSPSNLANAGAWWNVMVQPKGFSFGPTVDYEDVVMTDDATIQYTAQTYVYGQDDDPGVRVPPFRQLPASGLRYFAFSFSKND